MKNLITMTDFVLEQKEHQNKIDSNVLTVIYNFANFIKQPNELWMFVPCDDDGNLWTHPPTEEERIWAEKDSTDAENSYKRKVFAYQQAKERCLFEGLNVMNIHDFYFIERDNKSLFCIGLDNLKTVEDLVKYDLQLTQTAIKQIGL